MREMKDSGIEWVGTIPAHWSTMPNKYVMRKIKVINPTYNGENILSLTVNGVIVRDLEAGGKMPSSFDGYQILYKGNLLMCLFDYDVTPRCIGLIKDSGVSSPAYSQFVLQRGNDAAYFYYYYLMVDHTKALLHRAKNLRHSFTEEQLGAIKVPVPPIAEQERIADFLDSQCSQIDAISADIQKEIEILEQCKRSVITEAVTKGLNPDVEMKDSQTSWFGNIPQNWSTCKTLYVLKQPITDGPHTTPELYDEGIPFVSAEAVSCGNGDIDFEHIRGYISQEFYDECCKKYIPQKYDIYMIKSGATTGKVAIVTTEKVFTIWSPLAAFRCDENKMLPYFLYYSLQATPFQNQVQDGWNYGTQQNIGMRTLEKLKICKPPLTEQKQIVDYLNKKCSETNIVIKELYRQLKTLASYKESIIYEYVTGKKEVLI